ncbi:hypothetical protein [Desulfosporosinus nitroreducens]|uniref:hypothetical protein n=1 Tax=Desulfosporosinus nitroreducens TaxID=2018668 RepID=UPI00207C60AA|nr:hypothetical protein [Desulfosporosinus nitroreducens]MCO1603256.1 hypothetical protein [Desulfosporosinus nitroreducens]
MSEQRDEHVHEHSYQQYSLECSTKHSNPAIFSETLRLVFLEKVNSEKLQKSLTQWVEEIRDWTNDNAYLVGHIKVFVEGQESLWLSSTGRSINIKHSQGWNEWSANRVTLSLTAIIFGTSKEALREVAQESIKRVYREYGDLWSLRNTLD